LLGKLSGKDRRVNHSRKEKSPNAYEGKRRVLHEGIKSPSLREEMVQLLRILILGGCAHEKLTSVFVELLTKKGRRARKPASRFWLKE